MNQVTHLIGRIDGKPSGWTTRGWNRLKRRGHLHRNQNFAPIRAMSYVMPETMILKGCEIQKIPVDGEVAVRFLKPALTQNWVSLSNGHRELNGDFQLLKGSEIRLEVQATTDHLAFYIMGYSG